jgi:CHAT domain-containing protein
LGAVDLAVLSACETGLGPVAGGEGVLGLQRAFQVSGARTVVASLWKVSDEATRRLMERFYQNLWDKRMGRLEALRQAQLAMLREGPPRGMVIVKKDDQAEKPPKLPPYYWAAFVLSGDWR